MIRNLLRRCLHLLTYLSGEGSWELRTYESKIIDAVIESLDEDIKPIALSQLGGNYFIERIPKGRINVFRFYSKESISKISDSKFSDLLINITINVDGKKEVAHVTFYKGYFFSIEFKNPGKFYIDKKIETLDVKIGKDNQSYTVDIDRIEHQ